jgi:hypothetical protein
MRSYHVNGGPEQVWNQIYFWYQAFYMESPIDNTGVDRDDPSSENYDENDMIIACEMRANLDHHVTTSDLPAKVSGGETIPIDSLSLVFRNQWRIQFDGAGKIVVQDKRNAWQFVHTDKDEPLYAPTELIALAKPGSSRNSGTKIQLGNRFLGTELLDVALLKLRKRYQ